MREWPNLRRRGLARAAEAQREKAPPSKFALNAYRAAHHQHKAPAYRQAQPISPGGVVARLVELLEQTGLVLRRDSLAGVGDRYQHVGAGPVPGQGDRAS